MRQEVRIGIEGESGLMPKGSIPTVATPAQIAVAPCVTMGSHQPIKTQDSGTGGRLGFWMSID